MKKSNNILLSTSKSSKRIETITQDNLNQLKIALFDTGNLFWKTGKYRFISWNNIFKKINDEIIIYSPIIEEYKNNILRYTFYYLKDKLNKVKIEKKLLDIFYKSMLISKE